MKHTASILSLLIALPIGCTLGCNSTPAETETNAPQIGADIKQTLFKGEHIYFGDENRRSVDKEITFPGGQYSYQAVKMKFALSCPALNRCDAWDRKKAI